MHTCCSRDFLPTPQTPPKTPKISWTPPWLIPPSYFMVRGEGTQIETKNIGTTAVLAARYRDAAAVALQVVLKHS